MRISDWSSDVCSSDLLDMAGGGEGEEAWLNLRSAREAADRVAIRRAMTQSEGNISAAAKLLGISRPTTYDLLKQYRQIGRASCRESVFQNVYIWVLGVSFKKTI